MPSAAGILSGQTTQLRFAPAFTPASSTAEGGPGGSDILPAALEPAGARKRPLSLLATDRRVSRGFGSFQGPCPFLQPAGRPSWQSSGGADRALPGAGQAGTATRREGRSGRGQAGGKGSTAAASGRASGPAISAASAAPAGRAAVGKAALPASDFRPGAPTSRRRRLSAGGGSRASPARLGARGRRLARRLAAPALRLGSLAGRAPAGEGRRAEGGRAEPPSALPRASDLGFPGLSPACLPGRFRRLRAWRGGAALPKGGFLGRHRRRPQERRQGAFTRQEAPLETVRPKRKRPSP